MKFEDITGQRFGRLVAVRYQRPSWLFQCDCGNQKLIAGTSAKQGRTRSCGCLNIDVIKARPKPTFRKKGNTEYKTWQSIRQRCYNPNNKDYRKYGARGVIVCERWRSSFENFYADMGKRPEGDYSIDRVNNDGNYEPGNCRWATRLEQGRNKRHRNQWTGPADATA